MTSLLFDRTRPERNEARFYLIAVQPTLLDRLAVIRMWGRKGVSRRVMVQPVASEAEAAGIVEAAREKRLRRGYRQVWE